MRLFHSLGKTEPKWHVRDFILYNRCRKSFSEQRILLEEKLCAHRCRTNQGISTIRKEKGLEWFSLLRSEGERILRRSNRKRADINRNHSFQ